jgi:hypothetical protein
LFKGLYRSTFWHIRINLAKKEIFDVYFIFHSVDPLLLYVELFQFEVAGVNTHFRLTRVTEDSYKLSPLPTLKPQSTQSAGPVRSLIFCSISIFLRASPVAGRRP